MNKSDDELLRRPIIVVGAGRSGMNFLGDVIAQHGSLAVASEPRLTWKHGNDRKSDILTPEDARPEVIADIRSRFAHAVRSAGKSRLIDVTPGNSVRLRFVNQVFPDAIFVHFIRDGVDNVLSMRRFYAVYARSFRVGKDPGKTGAVKRRAREFRLRQFPHLALEALRHMAPDFLLPLIGPPVLGVRLPGMVAMRREMDLLDLCFLQWRASVELAAQFGRQLPPNRYMEVRIETFSEADIHAIYNFCGLDVMPEALEFFRGSFESTRIGPAMQDAFPEEFQRLKVMVEPTMRWIEDRAPAAKPLHAAG